MNLIAELGCGLLLILGEFSLSPLLNKWWRLGLSAALFLCLLVLFCLGQPLYMAIPFLCLVDQGSRYVFDIRPSLIWLMGYFILMGLLLVNFGLLHAWLMVLFQLLTNHHLTVLKKSYEDRMQDYQNDVLSHQVEEVENIYLKMRGWRHDYHHHMQTLKAYLSQQRYTEALGYLEDLELDLKDVSWLVESGNVRVDAILNSKLSLASNAVIALDYKATVPAQLTVKEIDLCCLLGNLLDNAIESCLKLGDPSERFIRLYIGTFKGQLYISVTNATSEVVRKIDADYISHKRGNHGHGLKRIDQVVQKYQGVIRRQNEPGVFVTEIFLPI